MCGGACHLRGSSTFGQVTMRLFPVGLSVRALDRELSEGRAGVFPPSLRAWCSRSGGCRLGEEGHNQEVQVGTCLLGP